MIAVGAAELSVQSPAICCVPMETRHNDCCPILFNPSSTQDVGSRSVSSLGVPFMFRLGILFHTSCYSSVSFRFFISITSPAGTHMIEFVGDWCYARHSTK